MAKTRGRHRDLNQRAWDGDLADGEQLFDVEVQTDAEHEQDDADLGQLGRELGVRHEAGRERPDQHACDEVADDGRQLEAVGDEPEHERGAECRGEREDQVR
ncbi:MAG: hypothetical protein RLZZ450_6905 [Pseudomonadota bacterium]|jgi:hypothetical protein